MRSVGSCWPLFFHFHVKMWDTAREESVIGNRESGIGIGRRVSYYCRAGWPEEESFVDIIYIYINKMMMSMNEQDGNGDDNEDGNEDDNDV